MIARTRTAEMFAALLLVAAGCHVWQERPATAPAPTSYVGHIVTVTTNRGARRLTLKDATARPDSVIGVLVEAADRRVPKSKGAVVEEDRVVDKLTAPHQRIAVAAIDVWSLEERTTSPTLTAVLVGVVAAVVATLAYVAIQTYSMAAN